MTRDEAIQVLQTALTSPFIYGEYADAIDMAIEALTQGSRKVTQESTQDLISRRDAIEAVRTAKAVFDTTLEPYIKPQDAVDALSALPSAEAVQGEWIPEQDTGETMLKCSECGCRVIGKWYRMAVGTNADRCPYCGRKLVD